jgi:small-conductance mechanosensitive channel
MFSTLLMLFLAGAPPSTAAATVTLADRPVFSVHVGVGAFSSEERARAIGARLTALAGEARDVSGALAVTELDGTSQVSVEDLVLFVVTDADAIAEHMARAELAERDRQQTQEALRTYRHARSANRLLVGAAEALAATLALLGLLWLLARLADLVQRRLALWSEQAAGLKLQGLTLLTPIRIAEGLTFLVSSLRWLLSATLLYLYLPLALGFFPWTQGLAERLIGYVAGPLRTVLGSFAEYLPKLCFIVVAVVVARQLIRLGAFLFKEIEQGTLRIDGFFPEWSRPTFQIVRALVFVFSAVVIFPYLPGAQSPAFQNISLFVGLLLSLGSSSAVANMVAGVILTYTRAFRLGDRVKIGDAEGDVVEKTLLVTRVRTVKNVQISIPNAVVMGASVINFSSRGTSEPLLLHTAVTIGYDVPWRDVHAMLVQAAGRTTNVLPEPTPFVLQTSLDDFTVNYQVNAYTNAPSRMAAIYSELHQHIQDVFAESSVEIMSPHFTALRDGSKPAIPARR